MYQDFIIRMSGNKQMLYLAKKKISPKLKPLPLCQNTLPKCFCRISAAGSDVSTPHLRFLLGAAGCGCRGGWLP